MRAEGASTQWECPLPLSISLLQVVWGSRIQGRARAVNEITLTSCSWPFSGSGGIVNFPAVMVLFLHCRVGGEGTDN